VGTNKDGFLFAGFIVGVSISWRKQHTFDGISLPQFEQVSVNKTLFIFCQYKQT
jgi:hypothetical protein